MQFLEQYLKDVLHIQPLGTLTTEATNNINDTLLSGEEIIINGFSSGLYVAHIDYANWLEKKLITNGVYCILSNEDEYVDLGLPSGKKWAKCNIGATSETESGLYFQWGDIEGRTAEEIKKKPCEWSTTPFNNGSREFNETYFKRLMCGFYPNGVLEYRYDAVYQQTKGKAHMPTKEDVDELIANTIFTMEKNFKGSGVNGYKFTSKKDPNKYIFIPAAGYAYNGSLCFQGSCGNIWSSSLYSSCPYSAWYLQCDRGGGGFIDFNGRYCGYAMRGIID